MSSKNIPDGFEKFIVDSPFDNHFGDIYTKEIDGRLVTGFLVSEQHLNVAGNLHGGAIASFADWQVLAAKHQENITAHTPTINLSVDYLSPGLLGDWLESYVTLQKRTGRMLFTRAEIRRGEDIIARSNAIYSIRHS